MKKLLPAAMALMTAVISAFTAFSPALADNDSGAREKQCKITRQEAEAIATKRVPGQVVDCDIEKTRKGKLYWSIDIKPVSGAKQEIHIDGQTGEVLSVETDD